MIRNYSSNIHDGPRTSDAVKLMMPAGQRFASVDEFVQQLKSRNAK